MGSIGKRQFDFTVKLVFYTRCTMTKKLWIAIDEIPDLDVTDYDIGTVYTNKCKFIRFILIFNSRSWSDSCELHE